MLQVRFRRLECHDESEGARYSTQAAAQQIDGFHSYVNQGFWKTQNPSEATPWGFDSPPGTI